MENSREMNFENKSGVELELNYLGPIKNSTYNKKTKELLYDSFIKDSFKRSFSKFSFSDNLTELKKRRSDLYNKMKEYIKDDVEKIYGERVVRNRERFLKEIDIEDQFKVIEKSQLNDEPESPETDFAGDLQSALAEKLGIEDYSDLEFYSSVGSHLDYCGVDGFFKAKKKDGSGFIRITFDLTMDSPENKEKQIRAKEMAGGKYLADVILFSEKETYREKKESFEDKESFQRNRDLDKEMIYKFADQIAKKLKERGY
jgi:hypothetical protein